MDERRRLVRFSFKCNCTYSVSKSGGTYPARVENITMRGVRVAIEAPCGVSPGAFLDMRFMFPGETVDVYGMVVWSKRLNGITRLGVFFVKIPGRSSDLIFNRIFKSNPNEYLRRWWDM